MRGPLSGARRLTTVAGLVAGPSPVRSPSARHASSRLIAALHGSSPSSHRLLDSSTPRLPLLAGRHRVSCRQHPPTCAASRPSTLAAWRLGHGTSRTASYFSDPSAPCCLAPHGASFLLPFPPSTWPGLPRMPLPAVKSAVPRSRLSPFAVADAAGERRQPSHQDASECGWAAAWFTPHTRLGAPARRNVSTSTP